MLGIPLKKPASVSFSASLRKYIKDYYQENDALFNDDLKSLENLRNSLANLDCTQPSSLDTLLRYYGQLHYFGSKFPVAENEVKICFSWYNSLGSSKLISSFNLNYEKACVLFNYGALNSLLGNSEPKVTTESLKKAVAYFQSAAGVFNELFNDLQNNIKVTSNPDMLPTTLQCLENLCLAQAQECFWLQSVSLNIKDGVVAKLAQKVADFYNLVLDIAPPDFFPHAWYAHLKVKSFQFQAIAQHRKAKELISTQIFGESVCRLQLADSLLKKSMEYWIFKLVDVSTQNKIKEFQSLLTETLNQVTNDNNGIYFEVVPPESTLTPIPGVAMIKPTPLPVLSSLSHKIGPPLFEKLIPDTIHHATSYYLSCKDSKVRHLVEEVENLNFLCSQKLSQLNLPSSLEAVEKPKGVPEYILSRSNEIKNKGGAQSLIDTLQNLEGFRVNATKTLSEAEQLLKEEELADASVKAQYGEKWDRKSSSELTTEFLKAINYYRNTLITSEKTDGSIRTRLEANYHFIVFLSSSKEELDAAIPVNDKNPSSLLKDPKVKMLRQKLNEVDEIFLKRSQLIEEIKNFEKNEDVGAFLIEHFSKIDVVEIKNLPVSTLEPFFNERLDKIFSEYNSTIASSKINQDNVLVEIEELNNHFLSLSITNSNSNKQREEILNNLDIGYVKFMEISSNLQTALNFYTTLENRLTTLLVQIKDFIKARDMEKNDKLESLLPSTLRNFQSGNYDHATTNFSPHQGLWQQGQPIRFSNNQNNRNDNPGGGLPLYTSLMPPGNFPT
ncbi:pH-response regulator protein palA/rim20 [Lobulomyces angularis]|nr:pH-response regulator protein palA/rim20 [Lobulomyces angularis]